MGRHLSIIELGIALGYFKDRHGVCSGVTSAWLEACFVNEEDLFNRRVDQIIALPDSASFITEVIAIKEKVKQRIPLSDRDKESLDILAFFEKISLYQQPEVYKALFDERLDQSDQDKISRIIGSDKILAQGGIKTISNHVGIFSKIELKKYITDMARAITESSSLDKKIGLRMGSPNHAMALLYETIIINDTETPCWRFMDINSSNSILIAVEELENIIDYIQMNYYDSTEESLLLNMSVTTTEMYANNEPLMNRINTINLNQGVLPEQENKVVMVYNLVKMALACGDIDTFNRLLPNPMVLRFIEEHLRKIDYVSPLSLTYLIEHQYDSLYPVILDQASKLDYPDVIDKCAALNINLDIEYEEYLAMPPLFKAASNGSINSFRSMISQGVSLDRRDPRGFNLAHFAALNGHDNIIALLAESQPALLQQCNNEGQSPAALATKNGSEAVLHELIRHHAIRTDEFTDLFCIAAREGHTHLIELFMSQGVDFNKQGRIGFSAVHYAALAGRVAFLSQLERLGADLCIEDSYKRTPLILATIDTFDLNILKNEQQIEEVTQIIKSHIEKKGLSKCKDLTRSFKASLQAIDTPQSTEEIGVEEKRYAVTDKLDFLFSEDALFGFELTALKNEVKLTGIFLPENETKKIISMINKPEQLMAYLNTLGRSGSEIAEYIQDDMQSDTPKGILK